MNNTIAGELRRQFEETFVALAAANPHIAIKDRVECQKALDLVEAIVRGTISRGVPTYLGDDELIQECLTRLPDAIHDYRGKNGASLKTYLKQVIRNDVLDAIARERREPLNRILGDNIVVGYETPAQKLEEYSSKSTTLEYSRSVAEQQAWEQPSQPLVDACRALLTSEQYEAVMLCDVTGMTQERAAERLGITRTAIASRLRKAHAKLRKHRAGKNIR